MKLGQRLVSLCTTDLQSVAALASLVAEVVRLRTQSLRPRNLTISATVDCGRIALGRIGEWSRSACLQCFAHLDAAECGDFGLVGQCERGGGAGGFAHCHCCDGHSR